MSIFFNDSVIDLMLVSEVVVNDNSTTILPTCGMNRMSTSRPTMTKTVTIRAATYIPLPQAKPMAAVTQSPAAVVKPRTTFFWKMMVPAPKKPMPETTWAQHGRSLSNRC